MVETAAFFISVWSPTIWLTMPPTMTILLSNLPFTSKIRTKSLGRHCLPACSVIAGTVLVGASGSSISYRWWHWGEAEFRYAESASHLWSSCPVPNQEAWVACYFDINRGEWAYWSTELATFESGWNPWGGGAKADIGFLVRKIACVNDCAECNIRLIQDFVGGYKSEDIRQNLMHVARDNGKKLQKELRKT